MFVQAELRSSGFLSFSRIFVLQRDGFVGAVNFQALASCGREGSLKSQPLPTPPESSILTKTFPGKVLRVPFLGILTSFPGFLRQPRGG